MNETEAFKKFIYKHSKVGITSITRDLMDLDKHNVTFKRLGERIIIDYYVMFLLWPNNMFPAFKKNIIYLIDSGLASKFAGDLADPDRIRKTASGPTVFTLEHLSAGFFVFTFFLALSFSVFILEFCSNAIRRFIRSFVEKRLYKTLSFSKRVFLLKEIKVVES